MGHPVAAMDIPYEFRAQMTRLMGLKFAPADMRTHWEALQDVPMPVLEAAVTRAQKTRVEFPTPAELREDADAVKHLARPLGDAEDRGTDLAEPVVIGALPDGTTIRATREWRYYCESCNDGGWRSLWCGDRRLAKPWQESATCERRSAHSPHEFVARCMCWDSNPALVKKRERIQQYAEQRTARR